MLAIARVTALALALLAVASGANAAERVANSPDRGKQAANNQDDARGLQRRFEERVERIDQLRDLAFESADTRRLDELDRLESRLRSLHRAETRRERRSPRKQSRAAATSELTNTPNTETSERRTPGTRRAMTSDHKLSYHPVPGAKPDRRPIGAKRLPPGARGTAMAPEAGGNERRTSRRSRRTAITAADAERAYLRLQREVRRDP